MDLQKQHEIQLMRKYWQLAVGQEMTFQEACAEMEKLPIEDIQAIVRHLAKIDLTELVKLPLNLIQDQSPMSVLRGYMEFENLIKMFHTNTRELLGIPLHKNPVTSNPALQPNGFPQANPLPANIPSISEVSKPRSRKAKKETKTSHQRNSLSNGAPTKSGHDVHPSDSRNEAAKVISEDGLQEIYAINSDDGDGGEMAQALVEENQQTRHLFDGYLKSCDENIKTLKENLHNQRIELDFAPIDILNGKIGSRNIKDLTMDELMDETKLMMSNRDICNVANIVKKNSRFLVAHHLWSKIQETQLRGEDKETKFSEYWPAFDTKKFEQRTRQRYCKVGKWMMKTKWGLFLDQTLYRLQGCARDHSSMLQIPAFQEKSEELKLLVESFSTPNQISSNIQQPISKVSNNHTNVINTIAIGTIEPPENLEVECGSNIQDQDENDTQMQKRKPEEDVQNDERPSKKPKEKEFSTSTTVSSTISHPGEPKS